MKNKRRKVSDLAKEQYFQLPKWLLAEKSLKKLSITAKMLYSLILDREKLSLTNEESFTDADGNTYQYYDQQKASDLLGISLSAVKKAFKDLQEFELIESVRQGQGKANRLYVLEYEISEDTIKEIKTGATKEPKIQEEKKTKAPKKEYKVAELLRAEGIRIAQKDNAKCEEFTDNNKLKEIIPVLIEKGSFGYDNVRDLYYKPIEKVKELLERTNNKNKPKRVKTRQHETVTATFNKYAPNELEEILLEGQKRKFKPNF